MSEIQHPYGPPELTMLACGVITPTETRTSRVTPQGWVVHTRDTVPGTRSTHAPKYRLLERAITVFSYTVVIGFIATMLAEIVRCARKGGL